LEKNDVAYFNDIIRKIQYEYDHYNEFSKDIIKNYLNILFLKAKKNYHQPTDHLNAISREQEIYNEFESLVQKHFLELTSVKAYADKIYVSPKHLSETVKKVSGQSALQIIHKAQLNYAKALLLQTSKNISEIAYELNFENPDYFSVFFKRLTGKSPLQFRIS
jgi:AraC-like DNA-binding protein